MYGQPAYPPPGYGAPAYGAPPPAYYPPPQAPAPAAGPMIINLGNNNGGSGDGSPCPTCGKDTGNIPRKKLGPVAIVWCIFLFMTTGCLWCIPFCGDGCKDTELVCVKCQTVKTKIAANCC